MPKVEITGTKGLVQSTGSTMPLTLDIINTVEKVAIVTNTDPWQGSNGSSIVEWTQPANTYITGIDVLCTSAPTTAAGIDLGYEVGTSSSGNQIVGANTPQLDQLIDAGTDGTDLAEGGLAQATIERQTTDAVTLAADATYTTSARTLYFNTQDAQNKGVTTSGEIRFIVRYISFT